MGVGGACPSAALLLPVLVVVVRLCKDYCGTAVGCVQSHHPGRDWLALRRGGGGRGPGLGQQKEMIDMEEMALERETVC